MPDDIQFDEEEKSRLLYARVEQSSRAPKIVRFIVEKGWVKDANQATYVLVGITALVALIAIVVFIVAPSPDDNKLGSDQLRPGEPVPPNYTSQ